MMWGQKKENGFWLATKPNFRFMLKNHDSLYIAFWRFRLRLMKLKGPLTGL